MLSIDTPRTVEAVRVSDRTLITGAASGIGCAFARKLAARGTNLILLDRMDQPLRELANELAAAHEVKVDTIAVDLADPDAPLELLRQCHARRQRITGLINCAGVAQRIPFNFQGRGMIGTIIDVNITALVALTRMFLPSMIRRGSGMIINVSSTAAFETMPDWAVYGGSKAFVQSFTESLRAEVAGKGVYIATVCPGVTRTPFLERAGMSQAEVPSSAQTPEQVADEALHGIDRRQGLIVTGFSNRIRVMAQRVSIRRFIQYMRSFTRPKPRMNGKAIADTHSRATGRSLSG